MSDKQQDNSGVSTFKMIQAPDFVFDKWQEFIDKNSDESLSHGCFSDFQIIQMVAKGQFSALISGEPYQTLFYLNNAGSVDLTLFLNATTKA